MVTLQEAMDYLGYDVTDTMIENNINRCIKLAEAWLKGAVGTKVNLEDPRSHELQLIVMKDFYDNREFINSTQGNAKITNNTRLLVNDLILQLKMELR